MGKCVLWSREEQQIERAVDLKRTVSGQVEQLARGDEQTLKATCFSSF